MRANKAEVVNAACNVVEALNALEASEKANDGTTKRYRDHLGSCIYRLKFLVERDNKPVTKRLRVQAEHTAGEEESFNAVSQSCRPRSI